MIEERPLSDAPEHLAQLREKINNYAMFILDEGLLRAYPETAGHSLCIQLDCATAPTAEAQNLINSATERLLEYTVRFTVNLLD